MAFGGTRQKVALRILRWGPENPVLIRLAASLPEAFAGSPGTQKRQTVNEDAQLQWAERWRGREVAACLTFGGWCVIILCRRKIG